MSQELRPEHTSTWLRGHLSGWGAWAVLVVSAIGLNAFLRLGD